MSVELVKFANAQAGFICEAMLGFKAADGSVHNKLVLVIVKRDAANKAEQTLRYWLDVPVCKVLCHDLWDGTLHQEHSEYKRRHETEQALSITPQSEDAYRISVMNRENGKMERLFFDLNRLQSRALARTVLDYLNHYELATMIRTNP